VVTQPSKDYLNAPLSIVVSGAAWSRPDLVALDELASRDTGCVSVWLLNLDCVEPITEEVLPGNPRILATPFLAEYAGKVLRRWTLGGVIGRIREVFPARRT
jgi:hypothetical protein